MFQCLSHDNTEGVDEFASPKRLVLGKRKRIAHPPKSRARRTFTSLANKQNKAKAPTPSKAKTTKEKDTSRDNEIASSEGFGPIPIPGDNKVPSKAKEAKQVEALVVNMEEALANLVVRRKILASKMGEPLLLDDILNVVDSIIDWSDPTSFIVESTKKAKANETSGGVKVSYGMPSTTKKLETAKTQPEVTILKPHPISELPPFSAGDFELVPGGFILVRKTSATSDGKGVEKGEAKATTNVGKEKGKKVTEAKKVVGPGEAKHSGQPFAAPVQSSEINGLAMRLLKNLDEMNEDRDVSLTRDALNDAESLNFEVNALCTHLSTLAKAYLGKTEFSTAGGDMAEGLVEWIREQAKHIEEMEKSLAKTRELVVKLEEGLVSAKAYLGLLNQEKERLDSNGMMSFVRPIWRLPKPLEMSPTPSYHESALRPSFLFIFLFLFPYKKLAISDVAMM
ncbi:hypothetical protein SLEP1_g53417 [Rubroshorea leprosula]|uniref:Uncharacterized protein n=1 Tax=Rubroshorea leprosula TaxID=152421 RepID=A0AAV5M9C8_9ROSI|nr:hypothetical protein SLEP1_g53417 [Rubroshorea leprosula]